MVAGLAVLAALSRFQNAPRLFTDPNPIGGGLGTMWSHGTGEFPNACLVPISRCEHHVDDAWCCQASLSLAVHLRSQAGELRDFVAVSQTLRRRSGTDGHKEWSCSRPSV